MNTNRLHVAITGAAGNLGSLLASALLGKELDLHLLIHKRDVPETLKQAQNIRVFRTDLEQKETLKAPLEGVDVIVHFAGVLFKSNPEKFLPKTNVEYFRNLLDVAVKQKVKRIILISFPHVEGETFPDSPACGRLDGNPESMHARTRLEEEKLLFEYGGIYKFEPVSLRVGMVYGKGILMIDAAQWFARHYLLGVWKTPTYIHLISPDDFTTATASAITKPDISGIYHIGDEGEQTLQEFLDVVTAYAGNPIPWRMPVWMIMTAARLFEGISALTGWKSPLTVDFIKIGMVSYYGDTSRMRKELL
ncbi:MAG: NAD-dependent epimerase/dehydratase family protein, partial [Tannerellaceae bacterium]|nr:NAD-dependent epimerase/dehydratase family protein [Tannerellaceae bacterium]